MKEKTFPVIEIFGPVYNGEGIVTGIQTHFIRFGGCTFRCTFCDSLHAVLPEEVKKNARHLTADEIASEVSAINNHTEWVTLSGGDPCMWDLTPVVDSLKRGSRFKLAVETQGVLFKDWLGLCDVVTVSLKGPASGMYSDDTRRQYVEFMDHASKLPPTVQTNLKIVVFNQHDYDFAKYWHSLYPQIPMTLQVGTVTELPDGRKMEQIPIDEVRRQILDDTRNLWVTTGKDPEMANVRVLNQLHTALWGHKQGV